MKSSPRQHLRPIKSNGLTDKKFKRLVETGKRVPKTVHPWIVVADLRRGSLTSLDRYLAKHKGIPDHLVAVELRKLISGSAERTRYSLIAVEHPRAQKSVGGRPKKKGDDVVDRDYDIFEKYMINLATEGKVYLAKETTANEFCVSVDTINRSIKKVERARLAALALAQEEEERAKIMQRRNDALAKLRSQNSGDQNG